MSNPPTDGESHPAVTPSADAAMTATPPQSPSPEPPTAAPEPPTPSPEPVSTPEPAAATAVVGMSTVPSAQPSWPVSANPYPVTAVPAAPPRRGQASLVILSILSTVLLLGIGVLTVLYVNDRQTITQQRATIDSSAADLKAKSAELDNTKKDLETAKQDAETQKACADTIRDFFKQIQSLAATVDPTKGIDLQSPAFQAISAAAQALTTKCGVSLG